MKTRWKGLRPELERRGFALVASITVMVLLVMMAIAMVGLSSKVSKESSLEKATLEAQANAKVALMMALAVLQEEMGPDQRVSAEAAIFDTRKETPEIDGVAQAHWLASYNSWGNWLNAGYRLNEGGELSISDTYVDKRSPMFRRWLLSLPEGKELDPEAAMDGSVLTDSNSVVLVGEGSVGDSETNQVTRAYLKDVDGRGKYAWWIGGENLRSKASLAAKDLTLTSDQRELAGGNSAVSGAASMEGLDLLEGKQKVSEKLLSQRTLSAAGVDSEVVSERFFDSTVHSYGLPVSVRTGALKRDLSLMFENEQLPEGYAYTSGMKMEPSIRPLSPDLLAYNPRITGRGFASWENMKRYFRFYRQDTTDGKQPLHWSGSKAWTEKDGDTDADEYAISSSSRYARVPLLAKFTSIYSTQVTKVADGKYDCYLVYSPVITLWNPYTVEMRLPKREVYMLVNPYKVQPIAYLAYKGNEIQSGWKFIDQWHDNAGGQQSRDFGVILGDPDEEMVLKPGEMRIFSYRKTGSINVVDHTWGGGSYGKLTDLMYEGFDPQGIAGIRYKIFSGVSRTENPGLRLRFDYPREADGGANYGNTPGGLSIMLFHGMQAHAPYVYQHDWLPKDESYTQITQNDSGGVARWAFDEHPSPFAFMSLTIKNSSELNYDSIGWEKDWRCRNWIQAPPQYHGNALYASDNEKIMHTQRLDSPYIVHFGPTSASELPQVVPHQGSHSWLGSGSAPREQVSALSMLDLPTAPLSGVAAFSTMRLNPGWHSANAYSLHGTTWDSTNVLGKRVRYQSGITGPGIGNSFAHPVIAGDSVYEFMDNSKSQDINPAGAFTLRDNMVYCDFWDHTFLINDALWDDYYVSSISDQRRPGATGAKEASELMEGFFVRGEKLPNSRMVSSVSGQEGDEVVDELLGAEAYLKAARYMMVDGAFNVNSTSVEAWKALFHSVRSNLPTYRDGATHGVVQPKDEDGIVVSRFNTATSSKEFETAEVGVVREDGLRAWTGVRSISSEQIDKLAEECVKQVKLRGPFLNFSEFVNRRLSGGELGRMGALQAAIDYDDEGPDSQSINYRFKSDPRYLIQESDFDGGGLHLYKNPKAGTGSRFAGIPGYVIQSDLLKPLANTLTVRDDTFRIRAYGESLDKNGRVQAKAWCEAIVQRCAEYVDSANEPTDAASVIGSDGVIDASDALSEINRKFGRKLKVVQFRWLSESEI